jgi:hypothetical protein
MSATPVKDVPNHNQCILEGVAGLRPGGPLRRYHTESPFLLFTCTSAYIFFIILPTKLHIIISDYAVIAQIHQVNMDAAEIQAYVAVSTWFFQGTSNNNIQAWMKCPTIYLGVNN